MVLNSLSFVLAAVVFCCSMGYSCSEFKVFNVFFLMMEIISTSLDPIGTITVDPIYLHMLVGFAMVFTRDDMDWGYNYLQETPWKSPS